MQSVVLVALYALCVYLACVSIIVSPDKNTIHGVFTTNNTLKAYSGLSDSNVHITDASISTTTALRQYGGCYTSAVRSYYVTIGKRRHVSFACGERDEIAQRDLVFSVGQPLVMIPGARVLVDVNTYDFFADTLWTDAYSAFSFNGHPVAVNWSCTDHAIAAPPDWINATNMVTMDGIACTPPIISVPGLNSSYICAFSDAFVWRVGADTLEVAHDTSLDFSVPWWKIVVSVVTIMWTISFALTEPTGSAGRVAQAICFVALAIIFVANHPTRAFLMISHMGIAPSVLVSIADLYVALVLVCSVLLMLLEFDRTYIADASVLHGCHHILVFNIASFYARVAFLWLYQQHIIMNFLYMLILLGCAVAMAYTGVVVARRVGAAHSDVFVVFICLTVGMLGAVLNCMSTAMITSTVLGPMQTQWDELACIFLLCIVSAVFFSHATHVK